MRLQSIVALYKPCREFTNAYNILPLRSAGFIRGLHAQINFSFIGAARSQCGGQRSPEWSLR